MSIHTALAQTARPPALRQVVAGRTVESACRCPCDAAHRSTIRRASQLFQHIAEPSTTHSVTERLPQALESQVHPAMTVMLSLLDDSPWLLPRKFWRQDE
jgi:hypothetical protein